MEMEADGSKVTRVGAKSVWSGAGKEVSVTRAYRARALVYLPNFLRLQYREIKVENFIPATTLRHGPI
jgi:hypothetical protein